MGKNDPTPIPLEDGPWNRMRDNYSPTARVQGALGLCQNAYPVAPEQGGAVAGRPGYTGLGSQLGGVGARTVQGIFQYKKKNSTAFTVAIVGGKFYTLNWSTRVWTETLTTAQLTAAGVTLSTTARIGFLNFADMLVISDGVNTPWHWDGTSGAGITKMTNAPVFYGQITAYYGRLFGIKNTDRATFVWSEVLQPNVGYEAGFANAWTLVQTDSSPMTLLVGTNDQLVVYRARSATAATGKPDQNFSSQGTREGVAEAEGTSSPWAIVQTERSIVFMDSDLHPQMTRAGGNLVELWGDLYETIRQLPRSSAVNAIAVNYLPAQLFLFAVCSLASPTEPDLILVFDGAPDVPTPVAVWRGFTMTALSMVENASGEPRLLHGYNGYVYEHGNPEDAIWDDFDATGTKPIEHIVETQCLGFDLKREMFFDRLDMSIYTASAMTIDCYYETPRGRSAVQQIVVTGGGAIFDHPGAMFDQVTFATSSQEEHKSLGLLGEGRWIKAGFHHKQLGEQFGLNAIAVTAYPANTDPGVP